VSLYGPVTTAEIRGWQCAAGLLLHELLDRAYRDQLPPLGWTMPALGDLIARCATAGEWTAWLGALQLPDVRPPITHGGRTRLRATGTVTTSRGRHVTVTLLADLDADDHTPADPAGDSGTPQDAA
jgi:hypothetical protein